MMTGAATIWLRVNIAAAEAPSGTRASARSGRPLALIPAVAEEKRKPWGGCMFKLAASPAGFEYGLRGRRLRLWAAGRAPWRSHHRHKGWGSAGSLYRSCREVLRDGRH